ncbi:hypothetical protein niasHS_003160 [Heterodera schachtii]|uniref:Uncharacterized protein n=1 Tax=Heterodera schachtii TaxID=97005 RepID=A0ABD2K9V0_HETSC
MKLILQLNALFACFLSAKLLRCRKEIIGTVEQSFVDKEPKNSSIACPEIEGAAKLKFCVKEVCFRDGKVEHYVTILRPPNATLLVVSLWQGRNIVFSDMEIPLGVPPSGSGRSTEPGIGHHFVMVFVTVALVGTAIRHGILL